MNLYEVSDFQMIDWIVAETSDQAVELARRDGHMPDERFCQKNHLTLDVTELDEDMARTETIFLDGSDEQTTLWNLFLLADHPQLIATIPVSLRTMFGLERRV